MARRRPLGANPRARSGPLGSPEAAHGGYVRTIPWAVKAGERLWPEWFTDEQVQTAKMDARAWNALYQQDPAPEDGDYFKREWFNEYREVPRGTHIYGASDYAVTEGMGDYSEHGIFGLDFNGDLYSLTGGEDKPPQTCGSSDSAILIAAVSAP